MNTNARLSDYVPATGSADLAKYLRQDVDASCDFQPQSDLDLHIVRLLALHPELRIRFRCQDLAKLDDAAKHALVGDMNKSLDVQPLRAPEP